MRKEKKKIFACHVAQQAQLYFSTAVLSMRYFFSGNRILPFGIRIDFRQALLQLFCSHEFPESC